LAFSSSLDIVKKCTQGFFRFERYTFTTLQLVYANFQLFAQSS